MCGECFLTYAGKMLTAVIVRRGDVLSLPVCSFCDVRRTADGVFVVFVAYSAVHPRRTNVLLCAGVNKGPTGVGGSYESTSTCGT